MPKLFRFIGGRGIVARSRDFRVFLRFFEAFEPVFLMACFQRNSTMETVSKVNFEKLKISKFDSSSRNVDDHRAARAGTMAPRRYYHSEFVR